MKRHTGPAALVVILCVMALVVTACGPRGGLSDRYVAERLAWRAQTLGRAMSENPDMATDEMRDRLQSIYEEIVRLFPPPGSGEDLDEIATDVARISGMSRLSLAVLLEYRGEAERARDLYASVADSYAFSRTMGIEAASRLAASLESAGEFEEAASVLLSLTDRWQPAEEPDGAPDPRILGAASRAAADMVASGEVELPDALDTAREYYGRVLAEWSGSAVGAAALSGIAESYETEGRWPEAILSYERLDREYGTPERRASLWIKLGDLYSSGMGDNGRAAEYYRRVTTTFADRPEGGAATISLARFDLAAGRYEAAREKLESVLARFSDEETLAATATQHLAMSYELEGKPEEAIARYGELSSSFPTSLYGLSAPLRVAEVYEEMNEEEASESALERAAQQYERIIRDYSGTPAELAARNYLITAKTRQEDWPRVAELLVETASMRPDEPASISMMFQAVGIYESRLSDVDAAREVLRGIASRYAGTPAGEQAALRLEATSE